MSKIAFFRRNIEQYFILSSLILLIIFFGFLSDNFLTLTTFTTILNQLPSLIVVTIGMTLVLIVADIDLSVGSVLGLSAAVIGVTAIGFDLPLPLACLSGIIIGALCGLVNGILSTYFSLPSFIVTLGMLEMARGASYMTTNSQTIFIGPEIQAISLPLKHIGISPALIISLLIVVFAYLLLERTVFGRTIVALGTNSKAAILSGIEVKKFRLVVLTSSGALAGLGGLFNAAYLGAADPNAGTGLELSAIAAAVIGGTSLMGGRGSIFGALAGVLIIAILQNGLAQIGVAEPTKRLITGAVIIIAVLFDRIKSRKDVIS
ncbi:MAG: ABC transporter permease [Emcibacteraceae bacterium]